MKPSKEVTRWIELTAQYIVDDATLLEYLTNMSFTPVVSDPDDDVGLAVKITIPASIAQDFDNMLYMLLASTERHHSLQGPFLARYEEFRSKAAHAENHALLSALAALKATAENQTGVSDLTLVGWLARIAAHQLVNGRETTGVVGLGVKGHRALIDLFTIYK